MKSHTKFTTATALAVACALLGYIAIQWPERASEIDIPPGKVRTMTNGKKGICVQGDPGGFSIWYQVTPPTSNEMAQMQALMEAAKSFKWPK